MLASRSGCDESTRVLLSGMENAGVDVTTRDSSGRDALAYASRAGHASTMATLLSLRDSSLGGVPPKGALGVGPSSGPIPWTLMALIPSTTLCSLPPSPLCRWQWVQGLTRGQKT